MHKEFETGLSLKNDLDSFLVARSKLSDTLYFMQIDNRETKILLDALEEVWPDIVFINDKKQEDFIKLFDEIAPIGDDVVSLSKTFYEALGRLGIK